MKFENKKKKILYLSVLLAVIAAGSAGHRTDKEQTNQGELLNLPN